jgi:hypothetical protein
MANKLLEAGLVQECQGVHPISALNRVLELVGFAKQGVAGALLEPEYEQCDTINFSAIV